MNQHFQMNLSTPQIMVWWNLDFKKALILIYLGTYWDVRVKKNYMIFQPQCSTGFRKCVKCLRLEVNEGGWMYCKYFAYLFGIKFHFWISSGLVFIFIRPEIQENPMLITTFSICFLFLPEKEKPSIKTDPQPPHQPLLTFNSSTSWRKVLKPVQPRGV